MQMFIKIRFSKVIAITVFTLFGFSSYVHAHEYWLEPVASIVKMGNKALVNIKNGEEFTGPSFPYNPDRVSSISVSGKQSTRSYSGRLGDYPAIRPKLTFAGIHSIAIETNPQTLTYSSWDKFTGFLDYHGFTHILDRHSKRKLPKSDVIENYTRSAKTLLQVKDANDQQPTLADTASYQNALAPSGHEFEMVLLEPPFGAISSVRLMLLFRGEPLAKRQTEMFWNGNKSERLIAVTDDAGIATFELLNNGKYLLSAVHLTLPNTEDAHWASYWASITFQR